MQDSRKNQQSIKGVRQKLSELGLPNAFRLTFDIPSATLKLRRVLPFKRSLTAIIVVAAIDIAVMIPAVSTYGKAMDSWGAIDSLFDMTSAVFMTAWVVGWSIAPLMLTLILLLLLTGREVLIGRPGVLQLGIGVPGLILSTSFDVHKVSNMRLSDPRSKPGTSWRGTFIAFDYEDRQFEFGSGMTQHDLLNIKHEIEMSTQGVGEVEVKQASPIERGQGETVLTQAPISKASGATKNVTMASPSTLALIVSNLFPIVGMFYFNWHLSDIMVLYWAESAVIAIFTVVKIIYIGKWLATFTAVFFLAHFCAFMAVHFLFIYGIFVEGIHHTTDADLTEVARLFISLWPALVALFISHGVSFVTNFVGQKEYEGMTVQKQMAAPYRRIIMMHLTLIFGGFVTMTLGDPVPVLLIFILVKIIVDVRAHLKEHSQVENNKVMSKSF